MPKPTGTGYVVALSNFTGGIGGRDLRINAGDIFREDHPAVAKWPYAFKPMVVREDGPGARVEAATAAPGEKRGA
jgi:hypothetical protein